MFLYVFIVLVAWKGVLGEEDICDGPLSQTCSTPEEWDFPSSAAGLKLICSRFFEFVDCLEDYVKKCLPEDDESRRKFHQDLRDLAADVCWEDSPLHLRVVEHIGCLRKVIKEEFETCREFSDEKSDAMIEKLDHIVEERGRHRELTFEETIPLSYHCLLYTMEMLCLVSKISESCGSDAADIGIEVVIRNGNLDRVCYGQSKKNLMENMSLLDLESNEDAILKQILTNRYNN